MYPLRDLRIRLRSLLVLYLQVTKGASNYPGCPFGNECALGMLKERTFFNHSSPQPKACFVFYTGVTQAQKRRQLPQTCQFLHRYPRPPPHPLGLHCLTSTIARQAIDSEPVQSSPDQNKSVNNSPKRCVSYPLSSSNAHGKILQQLPRRLPSRHRRQRNVDSHSRIFPSIPSLSFQPSAPVTAQFNACATSTSPTGKRTSGTPHTKASKTRSLKHSTISTEPIE